VRQRQHQLHARSSSRALCAVGSRSLLLPLPNQPPPLLTRPQTPHHHPHITQIHETQKLLEAESQLLRRELADSRAALAGWTAKLSPLQGALKEAGDLEHYVEHLAREAAAIARVSAELGLCSGPSPLSSPAPAAGAREGLLSRRPSGASKTWQTEAEQAEGVEGAGYQEGGAEEGGRASAGEGGSGGGGGGAEEGALPISVGASR